MVEGVGVILPYYEFKVQKVVIVGLHRPILLKHQWIQPWIVEHGELDRKRQAKWVMH